MEERQFDRLARMVGAAASRRTALRGLAAGLLGATGLGLAREASGKRRRRCGAQYAGCNDKKDCCDGLLCKELRNPGAEAEFSGTCAYKRGCGKRKDYCEKSHDCCRRFRCRGHECKRR